MPKQRDEGSREQPASGGNEYVDLQRRALEAVLELSTDVVGPVEAEIEGRHEHSSTSAEEQLRESTGRIEARLQEKTEAIERAYADRGRQIESEHEAAEAALAERTQRSLARIAGEFREIEKDARRQREDDLLMAETVAQATIKGLQKEFQSVQRRVAASRSQLDTVQKQAGDLLKSYRYTPEQDSITPVEPLSSSDDPETMYRQQAQCGTRQLEALRSLSTPHLLAGGRPYALVLLFCAAAVAAMGMLHVLQVRHWPPFYISGPVAGVVVLAFVLLIGQMLWRKSRVEIREAYEPLRRALAVGGRALDERLERAGAQLERDKASANEKRDRELQAARDRFDKVVGNAEQRRKEALERIEAHRAKQQAEVQRRHDEALQYASDERERQRRKYQERHDTDATSAQQRHERQTSESRSRYDSSRATLERRWDAALARIERLLDETDKLDFGSGLDWSHGQPAQWSPPNDFAPLVPFGHWDVDLTRLAVSVRERAAFLKKRTGTVAIPALLALPSRCSLFLQSERAGRKEAIDTLRAVMLRLLTSLPPGRAHFTIIDPVGLGENFAGFMHLVDYEEALVGGRIWTESEHIEARLTELTSHMENVIQKYLRNEFETIDEYNAQAGELVEPYRFLVVADFPANFNEGACRRLGSIVSSGARCGVFTLIAHDRRLPTPPDLQIEDLAGESIHLVYEDERFVYQDELLRQFPLTLDAPPSEEMLTRILHVVGREAKDSLRVEVPFASVAPSGEQSWSRDTRSEISVPLGHTGAVRLQHLRLGRGIAQHGLIAGKTGSGKSTLLHVIITNLALWYSPEEVEFYLVDFKKGVEFKTYVTHRLPHARAIAVESDREFGLSVLQRIDAEMARRGDLFRAAGVQDLAGYRDASGIVLPRTLLIVDEFQVFFTEDDKLSQDAAVLLDRLVRQGRAFGIHVLLGSQTLGGTASLARSTLGQMAVRVALQCSEADSQLILDDTNVAARLLSRPGEAIYNDAGGLVEGNSPFQTAWLPDDQRNVYLDRVNALADERKLERDPPIVFEGNAPADIRQNRLLARLLEASDWPPAGAVPRAWLGEAVAIKDPTSVSFKRQSGAHLLLVGQRDDAALAMMAAAMLCLAAQHPAQAARFVVLDARPADAQQKSGLREVAAALPHETRFVGWRDVGEAITELAGETQGRIDADRMDAPAIYLLIYGLQRYRMLRRQEEDFSFSAEEEDKPPAPDKQFAELLREGPPFGVHVLLWSDTLATLERTLDRASIGEFDNRVLFQMSTSDSSNLIDTPDANKLGFYRALLYSEERGLLEKFRPYAAFDADWLEQARRCLSRRPTPPDADGPVA